jgi:hypothetical protein
MKIRILPEAERDLDLGAHFYESHAPGAGGGFIDMYAVLDCGQDPATIDSRLMTRKAGGNPPP